MTYHFPRNVLFVALLSSILGHSVAHAQPAVVVYSVSPASVPQGGQVSVVFGVQNLSAAARCLIWMKHVSDHNAQGLVGMTLYGNNNYMATVPVYSNAELGDGNVVIDVFDNHGNFLSESDPNGVGSTYTVTAAPSAIRRSKPTGKAANVLKQRAIQKRRIRKINEIEALIMENALMNW